jgi:hypothetical protein
VNGTNLEKKNPSLDAPKGGMDAAVTKASPRSGLGWSFRRGRKLPAHNPQGRGLWAVLALAAVGLVALGVASCLIPLDGDSPASDDTVQYDAQGRRLLVIKTTTGGGAAPPGP